MADERHRSLVLRSGTGTTGSGNGLKQGNRFLRGYPHHRAWPECDPAKPENRRPGNPSRGRIGRQFRNGSPNNGEDCLQRDMSAL